MSSTAAILESEEVVEDRELLHPEAVSLEKKPLLSLLLRMGIIPFTDDSVRAFLEITKTARRKTDMRFFKWCALPLVLMLCRLLWMPHGETGSIAVLLSLLLTLAVFGVVNITAEWKTRSYADFLQLTGTVPPNIYDQARKIQSSFPDVALSVFFLQGDPLLLVSHEKESYWMAAWNIPKRFAPLLRHREV